MINRCLYYQAHIDKPRCWFVVAVLRSFEHLVFDRTLDKETSLFEFFVPPALQPTFEELMRYFQSEGIVLDFKELPNRLVPQI